LIFDNFGVGYSYSNDELSNSSPSGSGDIVYNYKSHFLTASYIKNIIPQINFGIILGLLVSGDANLRATGTQINFDREKSKSIKLLKSSNQMTIFGGYQRDNIEYIIGLQSTEYKVSASFNQCYTTCSGNYSFSNYKILSPMLGIGYLF
jgi:hypothetical protein